MLRSEAKQDGNQDKNVQHTAGFESHILVATRAAATALSIKVCTPLTTQPAKASNSIKVFIHGKATSQGSKSIALANRKHDSFVIKSKSQPGFVKQ